MSDINAIVQTTTKPNTFAGIPISQIVQMLFLLIPLLVIIFLGRRQSQKEQEKRKLMMGNLKIDDTVRTIAGIIGKVSYITPDKTMVEITTGTNNTNKITIISSAIAEILPETKVEVER